MCSGIARSVRQRRSRPLMAEGTSTVTGAIPGIMFGIPGKMRISAVPDGISAASVNGYRSLWGCRLMSDHSQNNDLLTDQITVSAYEVSKLSLSARKLANRLDHVGLHQASILMEPVVRNLIDMGFKKLEAENPDMARGRS